MAGERGMSEELVPTVDLAPSTLFGTDNPGEVVERASGVARTLADVVHKQNLVVRIGQSNHVRVEGWTFLGSLLGVFPVVEWTRPVMDGDTKVGWEARVEARTRTGEIVGAGEAECLRSENTWKSRDDYALRSMAQTRAVSKALRMPLGFVMQLAGFNPTPAEEMPTVEARADGDRQFPPVDPQTGEILPEGHDIVISEAQRRRLRAIQKRCEVSDDDLKEMIAAISGVDSSKLIPLRTYDELVAAVEARAQPDSEFAQRAAEAQAHRQETLTDG
jgi:hypothetical protein